MLCKPFILWLLLAVIVLDIACFAQSDTGSGGETDDDGAAAGFDAGSYSGGAGGEGAAGATRLFKHPLTDMPPAAEDIETMHFFPEHQDQKFPIGEVVTALCHFSNDGSSYYNISAIMGSLNSPFDFRHHFQNYSYKPFGTIVKAGEETTFKYQFQLHPELDPVDYQLAITIFYESETESFSTTFFNQTVELYSTTSDFDLETIGAVLFSIASTLVVLFLSFALCFPESKLPVLSGLFRNKSLFEIAATAAAATGKPSAAAAARASYSTRLVSDDEGTEDEWLKDLPQVKGSKAAAGRKAKK